jgi:uncharacterized membrane protein
MTDNDAIKKALEAEMLDDYRSNMKAIARLLMVIMASMSLIFGFIFLITYLAK